MTRWLLIAGDFTPLGGMDRANHALASSLASCPGTEVHLVTHRAWPDLERSAAIRVHRVPRPLGSHMIGAPLLASAGERLAGTLAGARVVANGGNADTGDVTWVHYLHAAYRPRVQSLIRRIPSGGAYRYYLARERRSLQRARVIVCNSNRTAADVRERGGIDGARTRVVYYGSDAVRFSFADADERSAARRDLGWPPDRPVALFIGALGDRRKGFDRLMEAWQALCGDPQWDVDLAVAGHGSELAEWKRRAAAARLDGRVRFLGFRDDVARLLAASDVLVHPARYEAYGLGVHEAICRGIPAIVSAAAGVAELYPPALSDLLIGCVEDAAEIADRLVRWRRDVEGCARRTRPFSDRLRARSWHDMSLEIAQAAGA